MDDFDQHEANCVLQSTMLFDGKARQDEIIRGSWERVNPINSLGGTRMVEFLVEGNGDYIDLHNCCLQMKIKIKKADNANLDANAAVACINYPAGTLFEQLDVYINNELALSHPHYGYRAIMETLLTYGSHAKDTWLQSGLYYKDTGGELDTLTNVNVGFRRRKEHLTQSRSVELISKIHSDLFNQERMLLNNTDLKLVFTRQVDDFCLMAANAENIKIEIEEASLLVRRCKLGLSKDLEIQKRLQTEDAKYFIPRVQLKTFTYAQGPRNIEIRNFANGRDLPTRLLICMVDNNAFNGQKALNPFNFKHYNMSSADILVNGKTVLAKPMSMNMATNEYLQAYWNTMSSLGYNFKDDGCGITRNEFNEGYFLLCTDLSATLCGGEYYDPIQTGHLDIELTFSQALPETVNVILYMEFNNTIAINKARRVVKNFA